MGKEQDLLDAARNGNIQIVGKILDQITKRSSGPLSSFRRSPSINSQDVNGYTPLHHACLNGHSNIVRLLLAHDALLDVPDIRGSTPLYLAAWAGHQDIVKMLLMKAPNPANPNAQTIENETALHSAAQHGHNTAVAILLAYGADPSIRNNSFQTALDLAAQFGRLQVVQILLRTHQELIEPYRRTDDDTNNMKATPPLKATMPTKHIFTHSCLHLASRNGHKKVVETLLAAGVDVNILTTTGSALHEAALCGKNSVVTTLLRSGIDTHATDSNGRTALDILKNYPSHVTYDIVTTINEFMSTINSPSMQSPPNYNKSQSLPKRRVYEKNQQMISYKNEKLLPKPQKVVQNALSSSMNSLDKYKSQPETYLEMEPIKWQKSITDKGKEPKILPYKPVYKQPYKSALMQPRNRKEFSEAGTELSGSYQYICLTESGANDAASNQHNLNDTSSSARYHCVDQYVEMSEPKPPPPLDVPIPSPRHKEHTDYVNINIVLRKTISKSSRESLTSTKETDTNNNESNSCKTHSPTPECPPPSVTEAEHTIFEYIQPLSVANIETKPQIQTNVEKENTLSSPGSETVEQFISDEPFAGLFKGSTLNLANDAVDGNDTHTREPLRSPSLVRSVKPIAAVRHSLPKQRFSTAGEDLSASRVWAEIDTIFENIDHEVSIAEQIACSAPPTNISRRHSLTIRNPAELTLGMPASVNTNSNWCHSPNTLIYGQILYSVYYLGSTVIRQLQGTLSTRKSIQKLKIDESILAPIDEKLLENCSSSTKYLKTANLQSRLDVGIAISHIGVKFTDNENKNLICLHDIENINCVCQDAEDLRYFAYITKESDMHYCHVFMVDNLELAKEIILTLGQAFEVAYQLAISKQREEECCNLELAANLCMK